MKPLDKVIKRPGGMFAAGDYVTDVARDPVERGVLLYKDEGRPDAWFVRFADGSTKSVGSAYLSADRED